MSIKPNSRSYQQIARQLGSLLTGVSLEVTITAFVRYPHPTSGGPAVVWCHSVEYEYEQGY